MNKLSDTAQRRLDLLYREVQEQAASQVGYPCNQSFMYEDLGKFFVHCLNNVGDPFHSSNYRSNTHAIECEVIAEFARLMHIDNEACWGYVTSGGTEGNMYGLYLARELYPNGVVYFSEETHYSVLKNMHVLNTRNIMIKSLSNGEIDYEDLHETLRIYRDVPAIILLNVGTTMKGAIDDITKVKDIFKDLAIVNFYIHADAALHGMILPFVDAPPYGFDAGYDSVSISGHKLIGAPFPCGIVLTKQEYVQRVARAIEYVGVLDTTLSGSRNGLSPLILWYAWQFYGEEGFREIVQGMLANAEYAVNCFKAHDIEAWRNPYSPIVVFPKPGNAVLRKWQIAIYKDIGHLITMPHVTRAIIDCVVHDYAIEAKQ